jgi:hypothetical protein
MRIIIILLALLPFSSKAQINRSANELAHETIKEYIAHKIFANKAYIPVSYGELKSANEQNTDIIWFVQHKFEIIEAPQLASQPATETRQQYLFTFYLDKKLKVLRAENIQLSSLSNK